MKDKRNPGARHGSGYLQRPTKHQTKQDLIKQQAALHKKYKEYSEKTTEELNEMYPILGGGYKEVCGFILRERYKQELIKNQSEEIPEGEIDDVNKRTDIDNNQ